MVQVVSCSLGGYDTPKTRAPQSVPCEFTHITSWVDDARHPRMIAKEPKLRPWQFTADDGPWIWIDGSAQIVSPSFVEEALAAGGPIAQWRHPSRDCIYQEATASLPLAKYKNTPVVEQAEHYRSLGYPEHGGLWATGLIVYHEPLDYLADLWWAEMNRWGYQDQISQPVALRNAGLRPVELPGGLGQSPWLRWHSHRSGQ